MAPREGTFVVSRFGRIEDVDDGACALLGYTRAELLSMHGADLVPAVERPAVAVSVNEMRLGTIERRQGRLVRKDRSIVAVDVRGRSLADGRLELLVAHRPGAAADRASR